MDRLAGYSRSAFRHPRQSWRVFRPALKPSADPVTQHCQRPDKVAPRLLRKYNNRAVRALGSARSDLAGLDEVIEGGTGDVQDLGDRGLRDIRAQQDPAVVLPCRRAWIFQRPPWTGRAASLWPSRRRVLPWSFLRPGPAPPRRTIRIGRSSPWSARSLQLRCGLRSRGWWLGKVGSLARQSASLRRAGLLQIKNHYCNNALRS